MSNSANNDIWIAIISSAGALTTAFGLNKLIPAFIQWRKDKIEEKRKNKAASQGEVEKLRDRIDELEEKLNHSEKFETQTRSTLSAMLPLMKHIMKDHPHYVALLVQMENNIIGSEKVTSAQGENQD